MQNIRHTSFFLVLQKELREWETVVTILFAAHSMEVILGIALLSWSKTFLKTNIIPGQHQEYKLKF